MTQMILLDTGPLVSLLYRRDQNHAWAKQITETLAQPVFTCEPVLTEACFLAHKFTGNVNAVLGLVKDGFVRISFDLAGEIEQVERLMARYANVPMSLADACLVRMSELYPNSVVLTADSDFNIYRRHSRQTIPVLMPAAQ